MPTYYIDPLPQITPRLFSINLPICCKLNCSALSSLCCKSSFHMAVSLTVAEEQSVQIVYGRSSSFGLLSMCICICCLMFCRKSKSQILERTERCLVDSIHIPLQGEYLIGN